jgi:hypothetical protein
MICIFSHWFLHTMISITGVDPGFQVRGGAHLKYLRREEGGAKIFGVFRVKNHDFTPKNLIFSNFRGARAGCAPPSPPGSAPVLSIDKRYMKTIVDFYASLCDVILTSVSLTWPWQIPDKHMFCLKWSSHCFLHPRFGIQWDIKSILTKQISNSIYVLK